MPAGQSCAYKLCRTSAVVDATTDKKTPPKTMPDSNTTGHALVNAGRIVAVPSNAFNVANARPLLCLSSKLAHTRKDAMQATPSSA